MTRKHFWSHAAAAGLIGASALLGAVTFAQDHGPAPRPDGWIFEDIEAGYAEALETGKPLLVAFR